MAGIGSINYKDVMEAMVIEIRVHGYREFRVRYLVGMTLMRIGMRVLGVKCNIEVRG